VTKIVSNEETKNCDDSRFIIQFVLWLIHFRLMFLVCCITVRRNLKKKKNRCEDVD